MGISYVRQILFHFRLTKQYGASSQKSEAQEVSGASSQDSEINAQNSLSQDEQKLSQANSKQSYDEQMVSIQSQIASAKSSLSLLPSTFTSTLASSLDQLEEQKDSLNAGPQRIQQVAVLIHS